ncbi:MAG: T9SS type A sorting domain-containing protein [Bacteroidetes bacterium]|nr:T9SS type A sorting domain-containing protein [Bacteroidota bacterium]MBU1423598.1 T9SS type A sorting domain-containing protein [Bacteroidota bacterium]
MPIDNWVTLKVYDILGREVATLVDGWKEAGRYEIEWDGSGQSSGVYLYKLSAGEFVAVKKMLLVK